MSTGSYQRRFNRFELKYLFRRDVGLEFLDELAPYLVDDPHGGASGYSVHSLYYDSSDLRCFWEKIDGVRVRRKLRLRCYGDEGPPEGEVFLEIKQRVDRVVQKRRVRIPWEEAAGALSGSPLGELEDPVLAEAAHFATSYSLRPEVVVSYRRIARIGAYDQGLRITLDTDLRGRAHDLDLEPLAGRSGEILDPSFAILEIKFNEVIPLWLTVPLARFEASFKRISKYCLATERLRFPAGAF
tara:strand:- start:224 stop:949 length:726 start_codon:yes stop_codon:yes gene_type:complete